ncbi:hypothetical protein H8958_009902 [Nasalis larvatus]
MMCGVPSAVQPATAETQDIADQTMPLLLMPMTKSLAGKLACMEYSIVELVLGLPLMVLAACAIGFCGPVWIILSCYVKITWKLCRTAGRTQ